MIVFFIFAAVLIYFSCKSLRGGFDYLNYFKRELAKPISAFTPFCSIIAPCRGLDQDLRKNLAALVRQNYPIYEVIFVVDDENDEAVPVIEDLIKHKNSRTEIQDFKSEPRNSPSEIELSARLQDENSFIKFVVAGKARVSSQKVENLREAVLHVSDESKVFVFVDSDARPDENWLRNLIAPLENEQIGAATGYRWFISKKTTLRRICARSGTLQSLRLWARTRKTIFAGAVRRRSGAIGLKN